MTISPLLQRFVDDELNRSADLISRTVAITLEQLRQPSNNLRTVVERQHYFSLAQLLQDHKAVYQRTFVDSLRKLVQADLEPTEASTSGSAGLSLGGLELMDETRVEADIEISRVIQEINIGAEWELRELQTFTSTLRGQTHVTAESNPLRSQSFARALRQAATALPTTPAQHTILMRVSTTAMAGLLRLAFAAACTRLEAQGVTPGVYRTIVIAPGALRADLPPQMDVTRPGALDGLLSSMPTHDSPMVAGAIGAGTARVGAGGAGGATSKRNTAQTTSPALEQALLRIEESLLRIPALPSGSGSPEVPRLTEHRAALMATVGEAIDRQIIELLSRLFETILSDRALQPGIREAIARLQVSALRIALLDPSMLNAYDHPVWVLLDRMVSHSSAYPHQNDSRLVTLIGFCKNLVDEMSRELMQDAAMYQRSVARFDAFMAEQLQRQQHDAQGTVNALTKAEQSEQLQRELSVRLVERMHTICASGAIRRFVTVSWARVLAESVLRFGDQSNETAKYLKTADELLWSLNLPDHTKSRKRLVEMLPELLQRLRKGMALIELPELEQQVVFEELMKQHSEALRPGPREAGAPKTDGLSPEEIVQRMRDENDAEAEPPSAVGFSDSLIDLGSMDTVPASLMSEPTASDNNATKEWVKHMVIGERYRIFLNGTWAQVQLIWRSELNHFYLFAGETSHRTHSVSQRALERLREAALLKPLHAYPVIQRAVDGMLRNLSSSVAVAPQ